MAAHASARLSCQDTHAALVPSEGPIAVANFRGCMSADRSRASVLGSCAGQQRFGHMPAPLPTARLSECHAPKVLADVSMAHRLSCLYAVLVRRAYGPAGRRTAPLTLGAYGVYRSWSKKWASTSGLA